MSGGLLELGPLVLPLIGTLVGELLLPRAYVQRHSQMAHSSGEEQGDINCYSCHACQAESDVTSFGDYITCVPCSSPTDGEEDRAADGIFLGTGSQHETPSPRHNTAATTRPTSWCCPQPPPTSTTQRESRQTRSTLHDDSSPARSILEKYYDEEESEDGEGDERRVDDSAPASSE